MFLKNRNISSKIKRSKVTDYAALSIDISIRGSVQYTWPKMPLICTEYMKQKFATLHVFLYPNNQYLTKVVLNFKETFFDPLQFQLLHVIVRSLKKRINPDSAGKGILSHHIKCDEM